MGSGVEVKTVFLHLFVFLNHILEENTGIFITEILALFT